MVITRLDKRPLEEHHPCIWMQAGVVNRKGCTRDYDCSSCPFDWALERAAEENRLLREQGRTPGGAKGGLISWKEKLRERSPSRRPCIHHLKGHIGFRPCTGDYRCGSCDFDQFFNDQYRVHAVVKPVQVFEIQGFRFPQGYYLHEGHGWARIEQGSTVRIGIDDFVSRIFGPLDSIETPLMGKEVRQGQSVIKIRRRGKSSKVLCPVSGVVTALNSKLRDDARSAGENPYGDGWLMTIHTEDLREDLGRLMLGRESSLFLETEADRLFRLLEEAAWPLAADGGEVHSDLIGAVPELGWEKLTKVFLRT